MGVPKFFRYMSERYPCLSELVKEYQIPEFDNLYLDMNGIIHMCSHPDDFNPHFRITEEKIFSDVFHYIEVLFRMIKPQKLFFMAVDGVAPRAKMNQQRGRRFRSAKDAEILENKARERGEDLPTEPRFDSNCITPGTVFMDRLHEQLKYFVANKISTDRLWQKCKIILSGHETPGEGEHKIMDYIRYMKAQPGYNPNTRHCLYGLDADLIMLGLCTHEPHFSLLREEVRFGKKAKRRTIPEHITFYLLHLSLMREYLELEFMPLKESLPFEYDMEKIIDDWVLMGFLVGNDFIPNLPNLHIANGALPILYNAYMKILPTLNGYINEAGTLNLERFEKFMQALASIDMDNFSEQYADLKYFQSKTGRRPNDKERTSYRSKNLIPWNMEENGVHEKKAMNPELEALIKSTDELLMDPKDSGWDAEIKTVGEIMETSTIDSSDVTEITKEFIGELVEKALGEVKKEDISKDQAEEGAEVEVTKIQMNGLDHSQKNKSVLVEPSQSNLEDLALGLIDLDESEGESYYSDEGESDESDELMKAEFLQLKNDYYMNKLDYSKVTPEVMRSQAEGYVRAIQWNLNYYYNGCCSWSWYYPHHYAPYISDVKEFSSLKLEYEMGTPFLPFEQLLAVLPGASKTLLPVPYQDLMVSEDSPIKQYYPTDFKTDLNGKKQEWEAVVLIPFIAENLLLESMMPLKDQLTEDEVRRNTHGPMLVYEYTTENQGKFEAPEYFPPVENCYAKITPVTIEDIRVPKDKLIKGPCLGAITDTYYPGFPTFKHLKYRGQLEKAKVKVFDQPSQNDNMIITILSEQSDSKLQAVAQHLIGKTVFVNWPHLSEALVVAVSDNTGKLFAAANPGEFSKEGFKSNQSSVWQTMRNASASRFWERLGIDVGKITILVHVRNICGSKYVYSQTGAISVEKQWNIAETFHPLQTVVSELNVSVSDQVTYHNIQNLFPVGSIVFMLGHPHYGAMGEVIDNTTLKSGRIKVNMCGVSEPEFSVLYKMQQESKYMPASIASQRLAITPHLLSRITGSIFVCPSHLLNDTKSQNRVNIGLNLKLNKKNEEIPGYTKKVDGQWLYSTRAVDLVMDYMNNFPNVFTYIQTHVGSDVLNDKDLFPIGDSKAQLKELQDWLKKQPHADIEHQAVGSQVAEPEVVRKIEEIVDDFNNKHKVVKQIIMQVKPHLLYKPEVQSGYLPPDVTTVFRLYDRVVNVRESYTVPYGCKGTVIGIQTTNKLDPAASNDMEVMYDIVFDQPFAGGLQLNCSPNRGYRVPKPALINITHGMRVVQQKTLNPATNNPWYGPKVPQSGLLPTPPHQPQMMSQNSAFVNWNPSNQGYSQQRQQSVFCPPFIQRQNSAPGGHYQQQPPLRPPGVQPPQRQPSQSVGSEFQAFYQDLQRNQPPPPNIFAPPPALPRNLPNHMPQFNQAQNYSTQSSFDAPRTVEQGANDETEALKKLLKISENNSPTSLASNRSEINDINNSQPISVQDFFAHARSQEKKVAPVPQQQKQSTPYYCVQLFNYCQTFGKGVPKYNYFTVGDKFRAQIFLFDGKTVIGDEMPTKAESSEDAAKKMMAMIVNGNTQSSNGASAAAPAWEKVVPNYVNPSGFPNPPKQWCQKDGTKTQPQEKRSPNVQKAKKNAPHNTSHKKEEQTSQPNSTFVPLQAVKQQRNKSSTNVQEADGANQSAGKSSQMASHHGSPGKNQAASTGNKQENTVSDDTPAKPKQRKSRIAANFSGVSVNK